MSDINIGLTLITIVSGQLQALIANLCQICIDVDYWLHSQTADMAKPGQRGIAGHGPEPVWRQLSGDGV